MSLDISEIQEKKDEQEDISISSVFVGDTVGFVLIILYSQELWYL